MYCFRYLDAVRRDDIIHDKFANFRYLQSYKVTMHFLTYIIRYNETCSGKKEKKSYIYILNVVCLWSMERKNQHIQSTFAKFPRNKQRMFLFCNFVCYMLFIRTFRRRERKERVEMSWKERGTAIFLRLFCELHQSANFFATHIIDRVIPLTYEYIFSLLLSMKLQILHLCEFEKGK